MLGLSVPINFNAPYRAVNVQDFWRRWHMTLSRFLRDYLYIPLGGSRYGHFRLGVALMLTMFLGGLWHGAGWTFVIWGLIHGFALICHRMWRSLGREIPALPAWVLTSVFLLFTWVMFRADSASTAYTIWTSMAGANGLTSNVQTEVRRFIHCWTTPFTLPFSHS